ncbi:MAG TPA: type II secretion system secretin GspD, partial [bacterium]|nr:type II secretion system secretin GspD [bacterium]
TAGAFFAMPAAGQDPNVVTEAAPVIEAPAAPAPEAVPVPPAVEEAAPPPPPEEAAPQPPAPRPVAAPPPRAMGGSPRSSRPMPAAPVRPGMPTMRRNAGPGNAAPMPVRPPSPNDKPPEPNDSKTGEKANEPVSFDFRDAPLYDVVEAIGKLTGRNFDVDANISSMTVTLITHDRIPPEMAYQVLESILSTRGYSMVESVDGHLVKIIPTADATTSAKTPVISGGEKPGKGFDNFSTHIVTIKYADGSEIQRALQILGTKNAQIDVYAPTNTLIITDTADGIRRMLGFLEEADVAGLSTSTEIFTLEFTRAEVLMNQITQVLGEEGTPGAGGAAQRPGQPMAPQPVRPVRATRAPQQPGSTSQVIGARQEVLRMVPDERLNSLIVVASEGNMAKVRDLVKRLDSPTPYEANNLHIYQLLNADAETVEQAIQPLVGMAPRKQSTGGGGGGAPGGAPIPSGGGGGGGGGAPNDVQPFEQKVQVNRYDATNSLLIVAAPQDYKLLEAFIARLDLPQRQVGIDATVMDVTISNDFSLEVDAAAVNNRDGFGETDTSNLVDIAKATAATATTIAGGSRAKLANAVLSQGSGGGLTTGIYSDFVTTITNTDGTTSKVRVPFVPLLLQAIEKLTDLEVLSAPSLVTVDNEESSIMVGQEVPFITSTSTQNTANTGTTSGYYGGYTRVERSEVGVKLKVTPQISEGDNVLVESEIEISDTDAKQVGTVDVVGPTINKSLITNKTLVKDGSTAVIGGLIRDTASRSKTRPPILGDIPVVGWMFGNKSVNRSKRNMVILLTPHIIKEGTDLERLTQHKVNEYYDKNIEEIFNAGFFKKVQRKTELRNAYRPTMIESESLTGRRSAQDFKRGDAPR